MWTRGWWLGLLRVIFGDWAGKSGDVQSRCPGTHGPAGGLICQAKVVLEHPGEPFPQHRGDYPVLSRGQQFGGDSFPGRSNKHCDLSPMFAGKVPEQGFDAAGVLADLQPVRSHDVAQLSKDCIVHDQAPRRGRSTGSRRSTHVRGRPGHPFRDQPGANTGADRNGTSVQTAGRTDKNGRLVHSKGCVQQLKITI